MEPHVQAFFDPATFSYTYIVRDPDSQSCAIIDSVLDYDPASGKTSTASADAVLAVIREAELEVEWILETHVHADHLSASQYLKRQVGGRTGVGSEVVQVQSIFGRFFNAEPEFRTDGSQFDELFTEGTQFQVGNLHCRVMQTPGHTPACITYVFDGVAFVGDTLFMPDYGTARTDFPGGDAATLFQSIARILELPSETKLYMCHDYGSETRSEFACLTTVAEERAANIHLRGGISEAEFVAQRQARDKQLAAPRLLLPSVQFNMRAGQLPPAEDNGTHYFKIPVRAA